MDYNSNEFDSMQLKEDGRKNCPLLIKSFRTNDDSTYDQQEKNEKTLHETRL